MNFDDLQRDFSVIGAWDYYHDGEEKGKARERDTAWDDVASLHADDNSWREPDAPDPDDKLPKISLSTLTRKQVRSVTEGWHSSSPEWDDNPWRRQPEVHVSPEEAMAWQREGELLMETSGWGDDETVGHEDDFEDSYARGYEDGYRDGYEDCMNADSEDLAEDDCDEADSWEDDTDHGAGQEEDFDSCYDDEY